MDEVYAQYDQFREEGFAISKYAASDYCANPSRLLFRFARYKHVSRLMAGLGRVLEIGSSDCLGAPIVADKVGKLVCIEEHAGLYNSARSLVKQMNIDIELHNASFPCDYEKIDFLGENKLTFDGIYCLDVLEHIQPAEAADFTKKCSEILVDSGVFVCGIPSLESQKYASPASKAGHVNCMSSEDYKIFLSDFFENVFIFGINDETLHTGFGAMCHYLLALCVTPKK